jgi:mRNA-degrading endonuclease RelE of RelBE toxin-antitoxin system
MAYKFLYFDEVLIDVQEAKAWYKEKSDRLENEFALAVETALERIQKMPSGYSIRYKNIRIIHTKVFPYNIHYFVNEADKIIVITAIVHNKRHPDKARNRV